MLIIGILASVALPQYSVAVEKTRAATYLPLLKSLVSAQERYFLENGDYATTFAELDVSPAEGCTGTSCVVGGKDFLRFNSNSTGFAVYIDSKTADVNKFALSALYQDNATVLKNEIVCHDRDQARWAKVCKALGGKDETTHLAAHVWIIRL